MEQMHICFASDDHYAPYMGMAVFSILQNAYPQERFRFYVLNNKISPENKRNVESLAQYHPFEISWLPLDESVFKDCDAKRKTLTLSTFGRYLIPKLISADKVLYLDCDVFVRGSLAALWRTELGDNYLAGAPDFNVIRRGKLKQRFSQMDPQSYVNAGVLLINNKKWREENLFEKLLEYTAANSSLLTWADQDAINFICRERKLLLPVYWNTMNFLYKPDLFLDRPDLSVILKQRQKALIRHFHPWKKNYFVPHRNEYIELMKNSPWKDKLPKDDAFIKAFIKRFFVYMYRHPFCFLLPKFYKRWYWRGTKCLFLDY